MTIAEYAEYSGFPKSRIRLMIGKNQIVAAKLDSRWYISLEATEEKLQCIFTKPADDYLVSIKNKLKGVKNVKL